MADSAVPPKPKPRSRQRVPSVPNQEVQSPTLVPSSRSSDCLYSQGDVREASGILQGTGTTRQVVAPVTQPLTSTVGAIPENDTYIYMSGGEATSAIIQPTSDLEQEVQALRARVESLKSEEAVICSSIEQKKREERELEQRVMDLKRDETRLKQICDEREGQLAAQSERERELQHRLEEISDREFANRQEAMRLERLADELHVQKKDLEHRKFDLENFSGDGPGVMEEQRAELMERERRLHQHDADVMARERDLDQRQENFMRWKTEQETVIQQRMSELQIGAVEASPPSQPTQPYISPSQSSPYHPHNVTDPPQHSKTSTHQFTPSQQVSASPLPYSHHNVTPSPHGMYTHHFSPSQIPPLHQTQQHTPTHGGLEGNSQPWGPQTVGGPPYGTPSNTTYPPGGAAQPSPAALSSYTSNQGLPASGGGYSQSGHPVVSTHSYTHAGHGQAQASSSGFNNLSNLPSQRSEHLSTGIIQSPSGTVLGVNGSRGSSSRQPSATSRPTIDPDEELAHHLAEYQDPKQTTDEIIADEEYARQLQMELNAPLNPTSTETDRELALALMRDEAVSHNLSSPTDLQTIISRREEQQLQEQRDFELAKTLEGPIEDPLNDLGS